MMRSALISLCAAALTAGCVPEMKPVLGVAGQAFSPMPDDVRHTAVVELVWSQEDPPVAFQTATRSGTAPTVVTVYTNSASATAASALAGFLVAGIFNAVSSGIAQSVTTSRAREANSLAVPLSGKGYGADFRVKLTESLTTALSRSTWVKSGPPTVVSAPQARAPAGASEPNLLRISAGFTLTNDACCLAARTNVEFFRSDKRLPVYAKSMVYISEPIGPERGEAAVRRWNAENGALMRQAIDEASRELTTMLDRDFLSPDYAELDRVSGPTIFTYRSPTDGAMYSVPGFLVAKTGSRVVFRYGDNNLLSIVPMSATAEGTKSDPPSGTKASPAPETWRRAALGTRAVGSR